MQCPRQALSRCASIQISQHLVDLILPGWDCICFSEIATRVTRGFLYPCLISMRRPHGRVQ